MDDPNQSAEAADPAVVTIATTELAAIAEHVGLAAANAVFMNWAEILGQEETELYQIRKSELAKLISIDESKFNLALDVLTETFRTRLINRFREMEDKLGSAETATTHAT